MTLRETIARHMTRRKMSQRALADLSGVPQPNISDWLAGRAEIRTDTLEKLAGALGLEVRVVRRRVTLKP